MSSLQRFSLRRPADADAGVRVGFYAEPECLVGVVARCGAVRAQMSPAPVFDGASAAQDWIDWQRAHQAAGRSSLVLHSEHYRILPMDAPRVPPEERKAAVRYQAHEVLDFPVDEARIDCLDVPAAALDQSVTRVFVVARLKCEIAAWMTRYRDARLALDVVDIPELALRNVSVLAARASAHIYLHVGLRSSRLVIVWQRELCAFRQFELNAVRLADASSEEFEALVEGLTLDIQRTADAFARQFHGADLATLWVSSMVRADALVEALDALQSLQHINLIDTTLLPRAQRLAPKRLLALVGVAALLVLAHFGWERLALAQALARADSPPPALDAQAGAAVGDPALQERIAQGEALRDVLRKQGVVVEGSARVLQEIFDALPDELWLTEVELGAERALRIVGGAADSASFARFAARLAAVPSLQGLPVTTVRLQPSSRSPASPDAPGDAATPPAQLFVLASAPLGAGDESKPHPPTAQAPQ